MKFRLFLGGLIFAVTGGLLLGRVLNGGGEPAIAEAISSDMRRAAEFTIYVPRRLPDSFTLKSDTGVSFAQGVFIMQFAHDNQTIFMSQQKKKDGGPSLKTLQGFTPFAVQIGEAIIGQQDGVAAAIVSTNNSVITLSGDGSISQAELGFIAKQLEPIK